MENKEIDFGKIGFILGAGSHVPYGMPVSSQLTEKIKQLNHPKIMITGLERHLNDKLHPTMNSKKAICRLIRDLQLVPAPENALSSNAHEIAIGSELDRFLDTFAGAQVYSIDAFLAKYIGNHSEKDILVQIGKVVLIYFIAEYENETPIGYHQFDWIQFIINEYLKDLDCRDRFFKKPPIIYTFNYDRILERSIVKHLVDFHLIEETKAIELVESLRINHVYGSLGHFQHKFEIKNVSQVKEAMSLIRVIGEERLKNTDGLSNQVYTDLKDLSRVYFLGYGFDRLNNDLLFSKFKLLIDNRKGAVPVLSGSHPIYAWPQFISTNIGLSAEDCRKIFMELEYLKVQLGSDEKNLGKNDSYRLIKVVNPFQQAFLSGIHRAFVPQHNFEDPD